MNRPDNQKIGIIGGGRMGTGIAFVFAHGGYDVSIFEPNNSTRNDIENKIKNIALSLGIDPSKLNTISVQAQLSDAVVDCGMVIEAAPENLDLKRKIFAELEVHVSKSAILASNTSSIPIAQIATQVTTKTRVIGTHFWNPPHLIELVEVVKGDDSDVTVCEQAFEILKSVGMSPVLVKKDVPGIIGNRLQHAMKREAIALVAEGVCDAKTLDTVVKKGFGARLGVMGPLEQSDLLGLELTLAIHKALLPDLDVTPQPHALLQALIESGKLGAKTGEGFREWTQEEADRARLDLDKFLIDAAKVRYQS